MFKASNLKSFALGAGLAIAALGVYALAATLTTFKSGDVVSSQKINENFAALNTTKQDRVTGTCAAGSSIRVIAADGTVTCQADNGGPGGVTYTAGAGLALNGGTFSIDTTFAQTFTVSASNAGLKVDNTNTSAGAAGIVGTTASTNSFGVGGLATAPGSGGVLGSGPRAGVAGQSVGGTGVEARTDTGIALSADGGSSGKAGKFVGKVEVSGDTTMTGKLGVTGDTSLTGDVSLTGKLTKKFSSTSATLSQATPIAYGSVNFDGIIAGGTPNFTAAKTATGAYNVVIEGETYTFGSHMVTVTPSASRRTISVTVGTGGGFKLSTFDDGFNPTDTAFTFVVFKP